MIRIKCFKKKRKNGEKGQILILVLTLLLLLTLVIVPTLTFIGTSLKTNQTYSDITIATYSAEAGMQDAIWNIMNQSPDDLSTNLLTPPNTYDVNDYSSTWSYSLTDQTHKINTYDVSPQIKNVWVPMIDADNTSWIPSVNNLLPPDGDITPPTISQASAIADNSTLLVTGKVDNPPIYIVDVNYSGTTDLNITSIGCWLPQGYSYNPGSSNLKDSGLNWLYSSEQVLKCAGNEAVVWTFPSGTTFSSLLSSIFPAQTGNTLEFDFTYSTSLAKLPSALAWITNTPNTDFPYSYTWDASVNVTDIISDAGNTEIEAYIPKSSTRSLGNAISGDYVAAGASLMTIDNGVHTPMNDPDPSGTRNYLVPHSSSAVTTIPSDADVQGAYLYWSGWFNYTSMPASTYGPVVNFKVDGTQVYFNGSGQPASGSNGVSSTNNQWRSNAPTGTGYSYSCYRDVTSLVRYELQTEYPSATNLPGNATYDIGPATGWTMGSTGNQWSYAGWSLIVIYSGPTTLGHQLYLYDAFSYADNGTDINIKGPTYPGPGGIISGFIVPTPITGEVDAGKLTAFVGDGDWCYSGDFIAINAPSSSLSNPVQNIPDSYKLWDGITLPAPSYYVPYGDPGLPNNINQPDNVWNSYSQTGGAADGIDIKTFHITWASNLIQAGDTSARIDVPTDVDSWNFIYMILSFRSSVTSGGSISYLIRRKQ